MKLIIFLLLVSCSKQLTAGKCYKTNFEEFSPYGELATIKGKDIYLFQFNNYGPRKNLLYGQPTLSHDASFYTEFVCPKDLGISHDEISEYVESGAVKLLEGLASGDIKK